MYTYKSERHVTALENNELSILNILEVRRWTQRIIKWYFDVWICVFLFLSKVRTNNLCPFWSLQYVLELLQNKGFNFRLETSKRIIQLGSAQQQPIKKCVRVKLLKSFEDAPLQAWSNSTNGLWKRAYAMVLHLENQRGLLFEYLPIK